MESHVEIDTRGHSTNRRKSAKQKRRNSSGSPPEPPVHRNETTSNRPRRGNLWWFLVLWTGFWLGISLIQLPFYVLDYLNDWGVSRKAYIYNSQHAIIRFSDMIWTMIIIPGFFWSLLGLPTSLFQLWRKYR